MKEIFKRYIGVVMNPSKEWRKINSEPGSYKFLIKYFIIIFCFELIWQLICSIFNLNGYSLTTDILVKVIVKDLINILILFTTGIYYFIIFKIFRTDRTLINAYEFAVYPYILRIPTLIFGFFPIFTQYLFVFSIYKIIIIFIGVMSFVEKKSKAIILALFMVLLFPGIMILPALLDFIFTNVLILISS